MEKGKLEKKEVFINKRISIETYIILLTVITSLIFTITLVIIRNIKVANEKYVQEMEELYINDRSEKVSNLKVKDEYKNVDSFVLFDGMEISRDICMQTLTSMKYTEENKTKYNKTYYNYDGVIYKGEKKGTLEQVEEDGYVVNNLSELAFSRYYDVITRSCDILSEIPNELLEKQDYLRNAKKVSVIASDIDGEGNLEYVVAYEKDEMFSEIILCNNNFDKIATLITLENSYWANKKEEEYYKPLTLNNIYCVDINEDGIMEILERIPTYEGITLNTIRVIDGDIEGNIDVKATMLP